MDLMQHVSMDLDARFYSTPLSSRIVFTFDKGEYLTKLEVLDNNTFICLAVTIQFVFLSICIS